MKKLAIIIGVVTLFSSTGCVISSCGITEKMPVYVDRLLLIDSSEVFEDPNNPGVFFKGYDTVFVESTTTINKITSIEETSYKVIGKSQTGYKR